MKPIAVNRKAHFDFFLFERFEAGISLVGSEVKSIREGKVNLKDSFVRMVRGEAFLFNCHITPYSHLQGYTALEPARWRKLLLKRSEINRLIGQSQQKGYSIIPLSIYFKRGLVKLEIALGKGKKQYDKREAIKERVHARESAAAVKSHVRKGR